MGSNKISATEILSKATSLCGIIWGELTQDAPQPGITFSVNPDHQNRLLMVRGPAKLEIEMHEIVRQCQEDPKNTNSIIRKQLTPLLKASLEAFQEIQQSTPSKLEHIIPVVVRTDGNSGLPQPKGVIRMKLSGGPFSLIFMHETNGKIITRPDVEGFSLHELLEFSRMNIARAFSELEYDEDSPFQSYSSRPYSEEYEDGPPLPLSGVLLCHSYLHAHFRELLGKDNFEVIVPDLYTLQAYRINDAVTSERREACKALFSDAQDNTGLHHSPFHVSPTNIIPETISRERQLPLGWAVHKLRDRLRDS